MSYEDIIVPMPKKVKKLHRNKVKRAMKMPTYKMLTLGQQIRMIREMRRISMDQMSRITGIHPYTLQKIEKWDTYTVGLETLNIYLKALGATIIAVPVGVPSYIDTSTESVELSVRNTKTIKSNVFNPPDEDE